ncbi:uncharacterized protein H6S33_003712 [Morchella sextelata]|uniref:uncharacterized protein n=1 Tax=Morchella sextelata TaxID=1174677 RepID=UPI001D042FB3|nr:uncharacterized protein H6S33_003712 [Morchella sextelata]KAH0606878.1 hypothetical protein H6S33_003712 [Morchella sextelata]
MARYSSFFSYLLLIFLIGIYTTQALSVGNEGDFEKRQSCPYDQKCGYACCKPDEKCEYNKCVPKPPKCDTYHGEFVCGKFCCKKNEECKDYKCVPKQQCDYGETICGKNCCKKDEKCDYGVCKKNT